ncbi:thiol-disulfide oxidoreductase DCC family protein [Psychromonas sp.]|uniref:thiol-disulfide oxidoreductase DCC family protein n=1 Tax=Psychromonas sp. TaxID=1884585 RepID=UPI003566AAD2
MIIFYDGNCPLCSKEMQHLKRADRADKIQLEDLNSDDFNQRFPHINRDHAMAVLHGQNENGEMLFGLDVTCLAWQSVGKYPCLRALRWPVIRPVADRVYLLFAKYRNPISSFLMPQNACANGACTTNSKRPESKL